MAKTARKESGQGEPGTITADAARRLIMVDQALFDRLVKDGRFKAVAPGRFRVVDVTRGYIAHLRDSQITTAEAASVLGISRQRLQQLSAEGWFVPVGKNRWSLAGLITGYVRFWKENPRRSEKAAAENRILEARAREIEMRVEDRASRLAAVDEVLWVVDRFLGHVESEIVGAERKITNDPEMRRKIKDAISTSLKNIRERAEAEAMKTFGRSLESGSGAWTKIIQNHGVRL